MYRRDGCGLVIGFGPTVRTPVVFLMRIQLAAGVMDIVIVVMVVVAVLIYLVVFVIIVFV